MAEWPLLQLSILCLLNALGLQVLAAAWALHHLVRIKFYRWFWGAYTLALLAMVARRWISLELTLNSGIHDFPQALLAFAISFLLLMAMPGLLTLLKTAGTQGNMLK